MARSILKRSVIVAGHRSSVSLEAEFWDALKDIAVARGMSMNELVSEIDRGRDGNLSSALRVHVLFTLLQRQASAPTAAISPAPAQAGEPGPVGA